MEDNLELLKGAAEAVDGFIKTAEEATKEMLDASNGIKTKAASTKMAVDQLNNNITGIEKTIEKTINGCLNESVSNASTIIVSKLANANQGVSLAASNLTSAVNETVKHLNQTSNNLTLKLLLLSIAGGLLGSGIALSIFYCFVFPR
jgi:chlorite dismutase